MAKKGRAEKKEKRSQKERRKARSKSKHRNVQIWKLYKIENGKVVRLRKTCPRCGDGTFLAEYKNRTYCGRCGWSQIRKEN